MEGALGREQLAPFPLMDGAAARCNAAQGIVQMGEVPGPRADFRTDFRGEL